MQKASSDIGSLPGLIPGAPSSVTTPHLSQRLIPIENGTKKYTSLGCAISAVQRGRAIFVDTSGNEIQSAIVPQGARLHFLESIEIVREQQRRAIQRDRTSGAILWNGDDPNGIHIPGEVRS